ncbi:hypothetical protein [Kineococcus arenarius]
MARQVSPVVDAGPGDAGGPARARDPAVVVVLLVAVVERAARA